MDDKITMRLFEMRDEKYKQFHSALCPGCDDDFIIGVRVPQLRKLAKELKTTPLSDIGTNYYEEIMLRGMLIGQTKYDSFDKLAEDIETYLPLISNWALCDVFCGGLKQTKKYKQQMLDFIKRFINDKDEFKVRFAVVMLLSYYMDEEYTDLTLELLKAVTHSGYYVKMAVAWALSVALVKHYDKTYDFFASAGFDKFTHNKALQKARESYRLTAQQKENLKNLKY